MGLLVPLNIPFVVAVGTRGEHHIRIVDHGEGRCSHNILHVSSGEYIDDLELL